MIYLGIYYSKNIYIVTKFDLKIFILFQNDFFVLNYY